MNLFELLIYLALSAILIPSLFLSMMDFANLESSLEHNIDNSHAALIQQI